MAKIKNTKKTILIIPEGPGGKSVKLNPKEEKDVSILTDSIKHAQELGFVRFPYKSTTAAKKIEAKKEGK